MSSTIVLWLTLVASPVQHFVFSNYISCWWVHCPAFLVVCHHGITPQLTLQSCLLFLQPDRCNLAIYIVRNYMSYLCACAKSVISELSIKQSSGVIYQVDAVFKSEATTGRRQDKWECRFTLWNSFWQLTHGRWLHLPVWLKTLSIVPSVKSKSWKCDLS